MAYVILDTCIKSQDCVAVCPVDCIHGNNSSAQLYINPEECIDCKLCEPVCPVSAIYPSALVPADKEALIEANRKFFSA